MAVFKADTTTGFDDLADWQLKLAIKRDSGRYGIQVMCQMHKLLCILVVHRAGLGLALKDRDLRTGGNEKVDLPCPLVVCQL
jgi:hypothetical protein